MTIDAKRPDNSTVDDAEQSQRFIEIAKEIEASERKEDFDKAFKGLVQTRTHKKEES